MLWSASYAFGFNNTVAVLGLAMLLAVAGLASVAAHREGELQLLFQLTICAIMQHDAHSIALFLAAALTHLIFDGTVIVLPQPLADVGTRHFLYRTVADGVYGALDIYFQGEYGPLLTYTPLWIYWLLGPLGASYEQAYFASHLLLNVTGLWCVPLYPHPTR